MRKKELKLVVTFHTTTDAIAMEQICQKLNISGRLIPVPRSISAGCGLAWKGELEDREALIALVNKEQLEIEKLQECMV